MEEHFFSNMNAATDHFAETEILKQQVWDIVLMLVVLGTLSGVDAKHLYSNLCPSLCTQNFQMHTTHSIDTSATNSPGY